MTLFPNSPSSLKHFCFWRQIQGEHQERKTRGPAPCKQPTVASLGGVYYNEEVTQRRRARSAPLRSFGAGVLWARPWKLHVHSWAEQGTDLITTGHTLAISKVLIGAGAGTIRSSHSRMANPSRTEGCKIESQVLIESGRIPSMPCFPRSGKYCLISSIIDLPVMEGKCPGKGLPPSCSVPVRIYTRMH